MTTVHQDREQPPARVHLHVEVERDFQAETKDNPLIGAHDLDLGIDFASQKRNYLGSEVYELGDMMGAAVVPAGKDSSV